MKWGYINMIGPIKIPRHLTQENETFMTAAFFWKEKPAKKMKSMPSPRCQKEKLSLCASMAL